MSPSVKRCGDFTTPEKAARDRDGFVIGLTLTPIYRKSAYRDVRSGGQSQCTLKWVGGSQSQHPKPKGTEFSASDKYRVNQLHVPRTVTNATTDDKMHMEFF